MKWIKKLRPHDITKKSSSLDKAFYVSLYIKAFDGVLQLIVGTILLFIKPAQIGSHLSFFTSRSLDSDPDDVIFRSIAHYLTNLSGGSIRFAAIYLIADAIVKLVLINEVLHKRYWAYIGLIIVLTGLVIFQTYTILHNHSLLLTILTLFDLLIIYLSAKEYRKHQLAKMSLSK